MHARTDTAKNDSKGAEGAPRYSRWLGNLATISACAASADVGRSGARARFRLTGDEGLRTVAGSPGPCSGRPSAVQSKRNNVSCSCDASKALVQSQSDDSAQGLKLQTSKDMSWKFKEAMHVNMTAFVRQESSTMTCTMTMQQVLTAMAIANRSMSLLNICVHLLQPGVVAQKPLQLIALPLIPDPNRSRRVTPPQPSGS